MPIKEDNHGRPGPPKKKNFELSPEEKAELFAKMQAGAQAGNVDDIRELGHAYQTGELGVRDYDKAFELIKKAADMGDDKAMVLLAPLYILGQGVEKDIEEAFALFEKAYNMGNMKAGRYLGTHYELGIGTAVNYKRAAELYEESMNRGDITAACQLGSLYERGLGVPQDYDRAEELYARSAERGDVIASAGWSCIGNLYETRTDGRADYGKAKEWYQKAADVGNPDGLSGLLRMGHYNPHPWIAGHNFSLSILCLVSDLHADPVYERANHLALVQEQLVQEALACKGTPAFEDCLKKSADLGYAKAQAILGEFYVSEGRTAEGEELKGKAREQGYII